MLSYKGFRQAEAGKVNTHGNGMFKGPEMGRAVYGGLIMAWKMGKWYKMRCQGCLGQGMLPLLPTVKILNFILKYNEYSLGRFLGWVAGVR